MKKTMTDEIESFKEQIVSLEEELKSSREKLSSHPQPKAKSKADYLRPNKNIRKKMQGTIGPTT